MPSDEPWYLKWDSTTPLLSDLAVYLAVLPLLAADTPSAGGTQRELGRSGRLRTASATGRRPGPPGVGDDPGVAGRRPSSRRWPA